MEKKGAESRILMFPWLAHGHVFPYLELAKNLASKNSQIYFCSTAINLTAVSAALQNSLMINSSIHLLELELPSFPDLPPEFHSTKHVPPKLTPRLFEAFGMSRPNFSTIISHLRPDLLIYDAFQPWAAEVALSLGIPSVHFATSGAATYSFCYHEFCYWELTFPYPEIYQLEHERKAMQALREMRSLKVDDDSAFVHFNLSCEIVLMRSSTALEGKYYDYLSSLSKKKIVPVGPLIAEPNGEESHSSDIMEWLNSKSKFSTLYISFGSENYLSKNQIEEIARGLDHTNVNFIWVVRFPVGETDNLEEALPLGFQERVKGRGLIMQGWAPQANILAHSSVGAFASHCGTSSVLESIHFGVPIIGIPLKLDQPLNARLVVAVGAGLEVERNEDGAFSGEAVAKAINNVFFEEHGEQLRLKADELRKNMLNEEVVEMNEVVKQISRLCSEHKQANRSHISSTDQE